MAVNKKKKEIKQEKKNIVFSFSALEQNNKSIKGPGTYLLELVGLFPVLVLLLDLYVKYIGKISPEIYRAILFGGFIILFMIMMLHICIWIDNVFHVFMIDENGQLYKLKVSAFWYKLRDKMYLLSPAGMGQKKIATLIYMIANMKYVVDSISETTTMEELIAMGKLEKIESISELKIGAKKVSFYAEVTEKSETKKKKISYLRLYEDGYNLENYLKGEDYRKQRAKDEIVREIMRENTPQYKMIRFTKKWSGIMAWIAAITKLYHRAFILYIGVLMVYLASRTADLIIEKRKKE